MATTRSYGDGCGIARALDAVGARWALLVVRELLFGPLRFTDLRRALPKASTNMLTDRLHELDQTGVITRRQLPPPAGATVYELTEWGRELEPILGALGAWGLRAPRPEPAQLSATSVMLFLQGAGRPAPDLEGSELLIELDDRPFAVECGDGLFHVTAGTPDDPSAWLHSDPMTFYELLIHDTDLHTAVKDGRARTSGDPSMLSTLLDAVSLR